MISVDMHLYMYVSPVRCVRRNRSRLKGFVSSGKVIDDNLNKMRDALFERGENAMSCDPIKGCVSIMYCRTNVVLTNDWMK